MYKPASESTLKLLRERNEANSLTFLSSLSTAFQDSGAVAYAFHRYITIGRDDKQLNYRSFFCNSYLEAIHGAIKVSRHKSAMIRTPTHGNVLIYNKANALEELFNPLMMDTTQALIPNVIFRSKLEDINVALKEKQWCLCIIKIDGTDILDDVLAVAAACYERKVVYALDTSGCPSTVRREILDRSDHPVDIFIWDEFLTDYEIPFGAFSVREEIYKPWNTIMTCTLHSSTYAGNTLSLARVKQNLPALFSNTAILDELNNLTSTKRGRTKLYKKHINSFIPFISRQLRIDQTIMKAKGIEITVQKKFSGSRQMIDCLGGGGCSLRGHNPDDLVAEVLNVHDHKNDYWAQLADTLSHQSGLYKTFPGNSGASVVEIGMSLAMMANREKSRIVVFRGNFSGKTLLALNGSDIFNFPFYPLYHQVKYIDALSANVFEELESELNTGNVALIWFETAQGATGHTIPRPVLEFIAKHKQKYKYFIGIDEILNGMYRTGEFVSYDANIIKPDIVTISKGLSDMTFPMSAVMVSEEVYSSSYRFSSAVVDHLSIRYVNQLGAHIALNALQKVNAHNISVVSTILKERITRLIKKGSLLKEVTGKGFNLKLELSTDRFPFKWFSKGTAETIFTQLCFQQGLLLTFTRILPPLNASEADVTRIVESLEKALNKNKLSILARGLYINTKFILKAFL